MRSKRVVQLVESGQLHNHRLVEYFERKLNERNMKNETV